MEQLDPNFSNQSQELNKSPKEKGLNEFGITSIAIVVIVVLLILGAATYFLITGKSTNQIPQQSNSKLSVQPSPTPDPTANWKIYTNLENGYSVKYPTEKFINIACSGEELRLILRLKETDEETCYQGPQPPKLGIETSKTPSDSSELQEYYDIVKEEIVVDGIKGSRVIATLKHNREFRPGYSQWFTEVTIQHQGKQYVIFYTDETLAETFDQILSTFKFTGSIAPCPSGINKEIPC